MTSLLMKADFRALVNASKAVSDIIEGLLEYASFERDTQINLRILYILYRHFSDGQADKIIVPEALGEPLVEFLMGNIFKFRKIFETSENYCIEIPCPTKYNPKSALPQAAEAEFNSQTQLPN